MAANGPFRQPYQFVSAVVLAKNRPYQLFQPKSDYIGRFNSHFRWNRAESEQIKLNKKKKKANQRIKRWMPRRGKSDAGAATLEPHPCFLDCSADY